MTGKFWGLEEAPAVRDATERPRKNTIERFNDELSVLERPLEGDVEYYDEAPPSAHWRKPAAFVLAAGLTACATLIIMRHLPAREAVARPEAARASIAAPAETVPAETAPPAQPDLGAGERAPAAGDAPAALPAARGTEADSVEATHRSRHSRHRKSGSHHHGRHH